MEHVKSSLRFIRESAGLSQDELAEAIGVNRKTIIAIESESGADPKISTVRRMQKQKRDKLAWSLFCFCI